jgi:hypothetical protein
MSSLQTVSAIDQHLDGLMKEWLCWRTLKKSGQGMKVTSTTQSIRALAFGSEHFSIKAIIRLIAWPRSMLKAHP